MLQQALARISHRRAIGLALVFGIGVGLADPGPQRVEQGEEALGSGAISVFFRTNSLAVCGEWVGRRAQTLIVGLPYSNEVESIKRVA